MNDCRQQILQAGLKVLGESGYIGFTQPRVAERAGMRQSHLTYYFPTRVDLLEAVGRVAIEAQLLAVDAMLKKTSPQVVANGLAKLVVRYENTRVLMSLVQAADQEPRLRDLFHKLADGILLRAENFLKTLDPDATQADARMLHAMLVGLAVVNLATDRPGKQLLSAKAIKAVLATFSKQSVASNRRAARPQFKRKTNNG